VRIETGDELSKRAKFALITWVGERVSPLKKAKVSTDKADVKRIITVCWCISERGYVVCRWVCSLVDGSFALVNGLSGWSFY